MIGNDHDRRGLMGKPAGIARNGENPPQKIRSRVDDNRANDSSCAVQVLLCQSRLRFFPLQSSCTVRTLCAVGDSYPYERL